METLEIEPAFPINWLFSGSNLWLFLEVEINCDLVLKQFPLKLLSLAVRYVWNSWLLKIRNLAWKWSWVGKKKSPVCFL